MLDLNSNRNLPDLATEQVPDWEVKVQLQASLIRLGPKVLFIGMVVALIFYIASYSALLDPVWITVWFILALVINLIRVFRVRKMSCQPSKASYIKQHREYVAGAFISGLLWGSVAFFYQDNQAVGLQFFIIALLVALPLSSLSANAHSMSVLIAFSLPIFSGLIYLSLQIHNGDLYFFLVACVYILITALTARGLNRTITDNIKSQHLNKLLLDEVTRVNAELEQLAYFDPLTKLHNRRYFYKVAEEALKNLRHNSKAVAFVIIDVDKFKRVNDTYGHDAGDLLLKTIAGNIRAVTDQCAPLYNVQANAARLGGDEFIIMLQFSGQRDALDKIAKRLLERINTPVLLGGDAYTPLVSIGVAIAQGEQPCLSELLKKADSAMYQSKSSGGNAYLIEE